MSAESCFRLRPEEADALGLRPEEADALGWIDLADASPEPTPMAAESFNEPVFLGTLKASQRGVSGTLSLDVLLDPAGTWVEIGGYRLALTDAFYLAALLKIVKAVVGPRRTTENPPWEGETRP